MNLRSTIYASILLLTSFARAGFAQQPALHSLQILNPVSYNPAFAGGGQSLELTGVYRKQWLGLQGSPSSQWFTAHLPINYLKSGVGIKFMNDALGAQQSTEVAAQWSYRMPLGTDAQLSFGAEVGYRRFALNGSDLRAPEGNYETGGVIHNDDFLPSEKRSSSMAFFGAGLSFRYKKLNLGVSLSDINSPSAKLEGIQTVKIQVLRQLTFSSSWIFSLGENVAIQPNIFFRTDFRKIQPEVGVLVHHKSNIFAGASFRGYSANTQDALVLLAGFKIRRDFSLAYAYDIGVSKLRDAHSGSHEILLSYKLNKPIGTGKPPKVIYNPRAW